MQCLNLLRVLENVQLKGDKGWMTEGEEEGRMKVIGLINNFVYN